MKTYAISEAGLDLIKKYEGFRAAPVPLADGGWVIGHSHVRIAEAGAGVTLAEAAILLRRDLAPVERFVNSKVTAPLTQSQYDALVSFCFSIGQTAFEKSDVLRKVNAGQIAPAACAMDAWRKSAIAGESKVYELLVRRRAAEKAMMLADGPAETAPSALLRAQEDFSAAILGAPLTYGELPAFETIAARAANDGGRKIAEILKSEPQTTLVLTQAISGDDFEDDAVIVTAHHRPVARKLDRAQKSFGSLLTATPENIARAALTIFGTGLMGLGLISLLSGDMLNGAVLGLPGAVAALAGARGFLTPRGA